MKSQKLKEAVSSLYDEKTREALKTNVELREAFINQLLDATEPAPKKLPSVSSNINFKKTLAHTFNFCGKQGIKVSAHHLKEVTHNFLPSYLEQYKSGEISRGDLTTLIVTELEKSLADRKSKKAPRRLSIYVSGFILLRIKIFGSPEWEEQMSAFIGYDEKGNKRSVNYKIKGINEYLKDNIKPYLKKATSELPAKLLS